MPEKPAAARIRRPVRYNRGDWDAVPYHVRLTLTEAAKLIGITRETLRKNYAGKTPMRQLPPGFQIESEEGGRTLFLFRNRVSEETRA